MLVELVRWHPALNTIPVLQLFSSFAYTIAEYCHCTVLLVLGSMHTVEVLCRLLDPRPVCPPHNMRLLQGCFSLAV